MSRSIDHEIWRCPPHTFERQPGKKKDTNDYQFKSCILGQKAGLLISGSTLVRESWKDWEKCCGFGRPEQIIKFSSEAVTDEV